MSTTLRYDNDRKVPHGFSAVVFKHGRVVSGTITHAAMAHGEPTPEGGEYDGIDHVLRDHGVRAILDSGAMLELRSDSTTARRNAAALLRDHAHHPAGPHDSYYIDYVKHDAAGKPTIGGDSLRFKTRKDAIAELETGGSSAARTDIARARQLPFGESTVGALIARNLHEGFNTKLKDAHNLKLVHAGSAVDALGSQLRDFQVEHPRHGVVATMSGVVGHDNSFHVEGFYLHPRFTKKIGARNEHDYDAVVGALGVAGVRQVGRELRRHGFARVSGFRESGLRGRPANTSGGFADVRLPESELDEELQLKHLWKQANGTRAFAIHHPQHGEVGYVVGRTHGDTFDLQNVMLSRGADESNVNALGPAAVRHLGRQLRRHTGARYVTSDTRQTGMRAKLGGSRIVPRVRIGESITNPHLLDVKLDYTDRDWRDFDVVHPEHGRVATMTGRLRDGLYDVHGILMSKDYLAKSGAAVPEGYGNWWTSSDIARDHTIARNHLGIAGIRRVMRALKPHGVKAFASDLRSSGIRFHGKPASNSRITGVPTRVRKNESLADALIVWQLREAYRPRMPLAANRSFFYKERHATRQASWISPAGEEHRMSHHGAEGHLTWLRDNLDKVAPNLRHPQAEKMAKLGSGHPKFDYQPFDRTSDNMVMGGWIRKAHKDAYQVAPGNEYRVLDHVRARHPDVEHLVMDVTDDVAQRYGRRMLRTKSYRYDVATGRREEL